MLNVSNLFFPPLKKIEKKRKIRAEGEKQTYKCHFYTPTEDTQPIPGYYLPELECKMLKLHEENM